MLRNRTDIGVLSALCAGALVFLAFGAASASAGTLELCLHESGTETQYTSSTCQTVGSGGFHWVKYVKAGAEKLNDVSEGASTLAATVAGVEFEIRCAKQSGSGTAVNEEVAGAMIIRGTDTTVNYEECETTKPAGNVCTVPTTITTNELKSATVSATTQQKYEPSSGSTFVTFTIGGTSCPAALKGSKSVTGSATAEVTNEESGVQEFTATSGSALKYAGQVATFISKNKFATPGGAQVFPRTP